MTMDRGLQGLLFSCLTKQIEGDSFRCNRSNGALYCVATSVWPVEPRYLRYRDTKQYCELHAIGIFLGQKVTHMQTDRHTVSNGMRLL